MRHCLKDFFLNGMAKFVKKVYIGP